VNSERLQNKARLADLQHRARDLRIEGKGRILLMRGVLDQFEPDLTKLKLDQAEVELRRLCEIQRELSEIDRQIRELEDYLG
jgi:hypothetical protein